MSWKHQIWIHRFHVLLPKNFLGVGEGEKLRKEDLGAMKFSPSLHLRPQNTALSLLWHSSINSLNHWEASHFESGDSADGWISNFTCLRLSTQAIFLKACVSWVLWISVYPTKYVTLWHGNIFKGSCSTWNAHHEIAQVCSAVLSLCIHTSDKVSGS